MSETTSVTDESAIVQSFDLQSSVSNPLPSETAPTTIDPDEAPDKSDTTEETLQDERDIAHGEEALVGMGDHLSSSSNCTTRSESAATHTNEPDVAYPAAIPEEDLTSYDTWSSIEISSEGDAGEDSQRFAEELDHHPDRIMGRKWYLTPDHPSRQGEGMMEIEEETVDMTRGCPVYKQQLERRDSVMGYEPAIVVAEHANGNKLLSWIACCCWLSGDAPDRRALLDVADEESDDGQWMY
jgi:hypothetical protein